MALTCYINWEQQKILEYSELCDKYRDVNRKIADLKAAISPKLIKKEDELKDKADITLDKCGDLEETLLKAEMNAESVRDSLIAQAKKKYDDVVDFANTQYEKMISNSKRLYETKKKVLESKSRMLNKALESVASTKSTAQYTAEREAESLFTQAKDLLISMETARRSTKHSLLKNEKELFENLDPLPNLPNGEKYESIFKDVVPLDRSHIDKQIEAETYAALATVRDNYKELKRQEKEEEERKQIAKEQFFRDQEAKIAAENRKQDEARAKELEERSETTEPKENDSDEEVYTPEELEEAKARLRNIYKAPKPEPEDAPKIIMNTKLKKSVKKAECR